MGRQGKEPAAGSDGKQCERQAAARMVGNQLRAEADIHCKLLFREVLKRKIGMSLKHMP